MICAEVSHSFVESADGVVFCCRCGAVLDFGEPGTQPTIFPAQIVCMRCDDKIGGHSKEREETNVDTLATANLAAHAEPLKVHHLLAEGHVGRDGR